ncbi:sulfatase-like hydrolase/transferase [Ramlibacter sp. AW1]|uniref:Sulfatase-like hydrolase/transferase n=1 Tax=Ramlibacter aurantiacus TaxID=2801330 RepID=A0A936ZFV9_9BURK|nr:sulfatase-like hydrolase/transferase [Ramlibacter aurantiacus]MBL0419132.1 sulfatase-like hydrolase/transferase [Ramlibacter aurantiacus]
MPRPNIVFIVADDLGYADLGCYGGRPASFGAVSPVIDGLARGGIRFTQGYANSPVCSPTRFALATGRYQYRLRGAADEPISAKLGRGSAVLGLPPSHPTVPSLLKQAGYRTALVGKWHLGFPPHFGPLRSGYDEFFGPISGGVDYFSHGTTGGAHDLWDGEVECFEDGYLTDLLSRRAVDFIDRSARARQPFFLSLHYTAPHWPWETREDRHVSASTGGNIYHLDGGNVETYRRMIHHMDEGIGWVMEALRRQGLDRDTLVVFTSDNGGERFSDNWPLVGGKMDLTEGGIRVPWVAHWPAVIQPGRVSPQACLSMDWSATVVHAAGCQAHPDYPFDGVSLLPHLRGEAQPFVRPMYWRMNHRSQRALRHGPWKYLRIEEREYLFNLEQDERERANRARAEPGRLAAMRADWEAWSRQMPGIPPDAFVGITHTLDDMP